MKTLKLKAWARVNERGEVLSHDRYRAATPDDFSSSGRGIAVCATRAIMPDIEGTKIVPVTVVIKPR